MHVGSNLGPLVVLTGERYKKVSKEVKAYCRGEYGRTPAPIDETVLNTILGDEKPVEGRYADTLAPVVEDKESKVFASCATDLRRRHRHM